MDIANKIDEEIVKAEVRITEFDGEYFEYTRHIDFDDFGEEIFKDNPKESKKSYIFTEQKPDKDGKIRGLRELASFPLIMYFDIDFKTDVTFNKFKEDISKIDLDENTIFDKFRKDNNIWIAGNSKNGKGIRLLFLILHKKCLKKSTDAKAIYLSNKDLLLKYLKDEYNLVFYKNEEIDYIDKASLNNVVLRSFPCKLNNNTYINNNCNVIINENEIEAPIEYTLSESNVSYNSLDKISSDEFMHYDSTVLAKCKFTDIESRKLFFDKYIKYYTGGLLTPFLKNFNTFNNYIDNKKFDYCIKDTDFNKEFQSLPSEQWVEMVDVRETQIVEKNTDDISHILPDYIYDKLPDILKDLTSTFVGEKRDVVLLSSLLFISYYFADVKLIYHEGSVHYNNFYLFLIGKSSSGKSIMRKGELLIKQLEKYFLDRFLYDKKQFDLLSTADKKLNNEPTRIIPKIGADGTKQGVYRVLKDNNGKGILFDTEADCMTSYQGSNNNHLDYSTLIRKSLGNESIDKTLSTEDSKIDTPKLSICVSGTKSQLKNIIGEKGGENGTYNRFLIYELKEEFKITNPFLNKTVNGVFEKYDKELFDFYMNYLYNNKSYTKFELKLTPEQEEKQYKLLEKTYNDLILWEDESITGIITRHFLIANKLMVTIAGLRLFEEDKKNIFKNIDFTNLTISDEDVDLVMEIILNLMTISIKTFREFIPKDDDTTEVDSWKELLYANLSNEFTRKDLFEKALKLSIHKSNITLDRWIKKMKNNNNIKAEGLKYIKIK